MKLTSRRYVAAIAGVAAVAVVSVSALALTAAEAASPRLEVNTTSIHAAAGSCAVVVVTPRDTNGVDSTLSATETVTIRLSEQSPNDGTQDLDFCVSSSADPSYKADTPTEDPSYVNGADFALPPNATQSYKAGPGLTNTTTNAGGKPDDADNASQPAPSTSTTGGKYATTNPAGVDRARYTYVPGSGGIKVGVVGLVAGTGSLQAFFDNGASGNANNYTLDADEIHAAPVTFSVTNGGQPGSVEAAAAVTNIVVDPKDDAAAPGQPQAFTATLLNSSSEGVRGVRPLIQMDAAGANPSATPTCSESNNFGVASCSFTGSTPGTDTLTVFVNRANGSAGPDFGETKATATRTTTKPPVAAAEARYLNLTPKTQTVQAGRPDTFTATITDVNGAPSQGVSVTFTSTRPGQFVNGASSFTGTSDSTGRVQARVNTATTDSGTDTITASIATITTQCGQVAGAGNGATASTPPGRCSDTATNVVTSASPSPSASSSASPSGSASPTPSASPSRRTLSLRTSTPDIQPNQTGILDATGEPNAATELRCYTRPNTDYFTARSGTLTSGGSVQFRILPGANTRCYVRYVNDEPSASDSVVINVHTTLSLSTVRNGVRNYTFQGRNLPRRAGQLITLYRVDSSGREIRTSNLTTDASGIYRVTRKFTGTGTFRFKVRTSQTLNNAAGVSNTITVTVR